MKARPPVALRFPKKAWFLVQSLKPQCMVERLGVVAEGAKLPQPDGWLKNHPKKRIFKREPGKKGETRWSRPRSRADQQVGQILLSSTSEILRINAKHCGKAGSCPPCPATRLFLRLSYPVFFFSSGRPCFAPQSCVPRPVTMEHHSRRAFSANDLSALPRFVDYGPKCCAAGGPKNMRSLSTLSFSPNGYDPLNFSFRPISTKKLHPTGVGEVQPII